MGISAPQGVRGSAAGAEATSWMCSYLLFRCRRRQAARSREALPPNAVTRKGDGGRGERGPGLRMKSSWTCQPLVGPRSSERSSSLRSYAWWREPEATKSRYPFRGVRNTTRNGLGTTRVGRRHCKRRRASSPGSGAQSPVERPEEEQRISRRTKASRTGKSFAESRRWGGSGLGGPLRIGARAPRKCASRYRVWFATGMSEAVIAQARGFGRTRPHASPRGTPKRSARRETRCSPVSMGGTPSSTRPAKSG